MLPLPPLGNRSPDQICSCGSLHRALECHRTCPSEICTSRWSQAVHHHLCLPSSSRRHGESEPRSVSTPWSAHGMTLLLQVASSAKQLHTRLHCKLQDLASWSPNDTLCPKARRLSPRHAKEPTPELFVCWLRSRASPLGHLPKSARHGCAVGGGQLHSQMAPDKILHDPGKSDQQSFQQRPQHLKPKPHTKPIGPVHCEQSPGRAAKSRSRRNVRWASANLRTQGCSRCAASRHQRFEQNCWFLHRRLKCSVRAATWLYC